MYYHPVSAKDEAHIQSIAWHPSNDSSPKKLGHWECRILSQSSRRPFLETKKTSFSVMLRGTDRKLWHLDAEGEPPTSALAEGNLTFCEIDGNVFFKKYRVEGQARKVFGNVPRDKIHRHKVTCTKKELCVNMVVVLQGSQFFKHVHLWKDGRMED